MSFKNRRWMTRKEGWGIKKQSEAGWDNTRGYWKLDIGYWTRILDGWILVSMSRIHNLASRISFFTSLQAGGTGFFDEGPGFQRPWTYFLRL
jgi:hypothetical protein